MAEGIMKGKIPLYSTCGVTFSWSHMTEMSTGCETHPAILAWGSYRGWCQRYERSAWLTSLIKVTWLHSKVGAIKTRAGTDVRPWVLESCRWRTVGVCACSFMLLSTLWWQSAQKRGHGTLFQIIQKQGQSAGRSRGLRKTHRDWLREFLWSSLL